MRDTAADVMMDVLYDWGVEVVFGLPGDGINGIMEALRKRKDRIRFIQVRHFKWEQMVFLGNPEYGVDLHPIDFAAYARACGGSGFTIEDPAECGDILDAALATPGPVVVEAVVDPFEPPMPPKITAKEAAKFAESLAKGEPNRAKIALTILSDKVRELV
ncbi:MAG TPA: thiamine pyrophosphate-binding protein [Blastocatellia bacterium]|jgi:thiamine pyrophosphate-dependent acetolactate synthase large subunit-like protein|nr:thiamine pyrophosphate-binding protein [Blastocatellia bacterium]